WRWASLPCLALEPAQARVDLALHSLLQTRHGQRRLALRRIEARNHLDAAHGIRGTVAARADEWVVCLFHLFSPSDAKNSSSDGTMPGWHRLHLAQNRCVLPLPIPMVSHSCSSPFSSQSGRATCATEMFS